jgi:hypothetical protein
MVPAPLRASLAHDLSLPSQCSATSHAPLAGRHAVVGGSTASGGHTPVMPVHVSAMSHGPPLGRHTVVVGAKPVARHTGVEPEQSSEPVSHGLPVSHGAPVVHESTQRPAGSQVPPGHGVPDGTNASGGHVDVPPAQRSATSHGPAATRHTSVGSPVPLVAMHIGAGGVPTHVVVPELQVPGTTQ